MAVPVDIQESRITVLGTARSGLAAAKLLQSKGGQVFVSDTASLNSRQAEAAELEKLDVEFEFGSHSNRVYQSDWIVTSPGISEHSAILQNMKGKGIPVFSELEVAGWFCKAPICAVTGSNGKTTVTTLLGKMFRNAGLSTIVAGNVGEALSLHADETTETGVAVVEVSSFQLEFIREFHPKVSVFLNLSPDHLDRHGSMDYYGGVKARLFQNQGPEDFLIYNGEDEAVSRLTLKAESKRLAFGLNSNSGFQAFVRDDVLKLMVQHNEVEVLPVQSMRLKGEHNVLNGLAAALAASAMGVELPFIRRTLENFKSLPHRMEPVRILRGVRYINDSKATNVFSVLYALKAFSDPIILIAGGRDKNSDFSLLRKAVRKHVKAAVLIGEAAPKIEKALAGCTEILNASTLQEAIESASQIAEDGEIVMLSPACASFDMFKSYEDRGDQFREVVQKLG